MTQQLRSMLFAPGNKAELLQKFTKIQPDAAVIDLEDAVPDSEKNAARENVKEFGTSFKNEKFSVFVRVNPVSSEFFESDIQATGPEIDGIVIPKISSVEELQKAESLLSTSALANRIVVGIETVRGLTSAPDILLRSSVIAAYFGAEDYIADLGGVRTDSNEEVFFARSQMGIAGRLTGIPVIDQIVANFSDTERFKRESRQARSLGFTGKLCIHPSQVSLANESFSPTEQEISRAKELLSNYEEAVSQGSASIVFDGQMIDEALAKQARRILDLSD
ncbi:MAG: CoA ester lyase [Acidimicrobiales bacterium]|jgi:citrate lyase subunit beta/citryl-CoA lyase|nr:CoA ester lyase [Acidimicrobiales bacterium]MDP6298989.1 CoA ester lyase [Acidimicrobiales bacterium]HJM28501.1 CoA ester lyase [Acidimicrobiales bacterium]HJM97769.1 CoA ester lyase [Acidimicrobiales bacterium]